MELLEAKEENKLAFICLADNLVTKARPEYPQFVKELDSIIVKVMKVLKTMNLAKSDQQCIMSIVAKWREWQFFDARNQEKIERIWNNKPEPEPEPEPIIMNPATWSDNLPPHLTCSLCLDILKDPVKLTCCRTKLCRLCANNEFSKNHRTSCGFEFCTKLTSPKITYIGCQDLQLQVTTWRFRQLREIKMEQNDETTSIESEESTSNDSEATDATYEYKEDTKYLIKQEMQMQNEDGKEPTSTKPSPSETTPDLTLDPTTEFDNRKNKWSTERKCAFKSCGSTYHDAYACPILKPEKMPQNIQQLCLNAGICMRCLGELSHRRHNEVCKGYRSYIKPPNVKNYKECVKIIDTDCYACTVTLPNGNKENINRKICQHAIDRAKENQDQSLRKPATYKFNAYCPIPNPEFQAAKQLAFGPIDSVITAQRIKQSFMSWGKVNHFFIQPKEAGRSPSLIYGYVVYQTEKEAQQLLRMKSLFIPKCKRRSARPYLLRLKEMDGLPIQWTY